MRLRPSSSSKKCSSAPGLSLIEMLVVIAAIGILMNIALYTLGGARQGAEEQKDKRNAQEIANVANTASAAGAQFVVEGNLRATIDQLRDGVSPNSGVFRNRTFKIPSLQEADVKGAMRYLALVDDAIQFRMDGSGG